MGYVYLKFEGHRIFTLLFFLCPSNRVFQKKTQRGQLYSKSLLFLFATYPGKHEAVQSEVMYEF